MIILGVGGRKGKRGVGSFGDKFRKERERQGVKLEDVSNSTKISSRMLRAIEDEHFDQLPGGVFNKGFIRAYAKYLGLDEEETIASYLDALNPASGDQPGPEKPAPQSSTTERRSGPTAGRRRTADRRSETRRSSPAQTDELPELQLPKAEHVRARRKMAVYSDSGGLPWRIPVLVVLVVVAGAIWWTRSRNAHAGGANPASLRVAVAAPAPTPAPVTTTSTGRTLLGSTDADTTASTASPHKLSTTHATVKAVSNPATPASSPNSAGSLTNSTAAAQVTKQQGTKEQVAEEATQADEQDSQSSPTTADAPKPRANLTLVIRASENSWISVTADGKPVLQETLIAPAHASVRAAREIVVRAGNAAGITFSLNGQEIASQGAEGEVKTLVFDSSGMRATTPTPP
jgi:cytoskeletal protein RodZ